MRRAVLLVLAFAGVLNAQRAAVSLRILSPADGSYVSGPWMLSAAIEPDSGTVQKISFFADGQLVCQVQAAPFECAWNAGVDVRQHVIRAVATLSDGTRLVKNVRTSDGGFAERVDVEVVHVTASVTDDRGRFVNGLARDAFEVFEDGVRQNVTYFAAESIPLELVVAVDASQSMTAAIPRLKVAVRKFLSALQPNDRVTLLAFNDNVFTLARPEVDPAIRLEALDRLTAWGGTALYDVIVKGHELLGRQRGRRALVIFTDGDDQSSRHGLDAVLKAVETSDVSIYMIGQGRGNEVRELRSLMERLAQLSGGRAFFTSRIDELEQDFARITEELSHQYLLSYVPANRKRDESWRKITVEVDDSRLSVRSRQGYRVAATP